MSPAACESAAARQSNVDPAAMWWTLTPGGIADAGAALLSTINWPLVPLTCRRRPPKSSITLHGSLVVEITTLSGTWFFLSVIQQCSFDPRPARRRCGGPMVLGDPPPIPGSALLVL